MGVLVFDMNNSGGSFWLGESDFMKLKKAGWTIHWIQETGQRSNMLYDQPPETYVCQKNFPVPPEHVSYLGTRITGAAKSTQDPDATIREWEELTDQKAGAVGCTCCGPPHEFEYYDEDGKRHWLNLVGEAVLPTEWE